MQFRLPGLVFSCVLAVSLAAQQGPGNRNAARVTPRNPIPSPLADALPALQKQSAWEQDTRYEGANPDKTKRGVYPVGNGRVFTYMGLGERANTMMALTGPSYAAPERRLPRGHFGELTLDLDGLDLAVQRVRRVTDANFVITEDSTVAGLALRTLTFATPGRTTITRVIAVVNGTRAKALGISLNARLTGSTARVAGNNLVKQYAKGTHRCHAVFSMDKAQATPGKLTARFDLGAGESFTTVLTIATAKGEAGSAANKSPAPSLEGATKNASDCLAWWGKKIREMPRLRTDHNRIMDLFKDWKVLMLTMRDAHSGVVSPMVTRRGAWIRESSGPLLTFLRYNMWDESKALINYYYNAIRLTGEVREHYPLDLDFSSLAGKKTNFDEITFPDSELPSWIVIHHFWYYRSTRDAKLIEEHKPLLLACLKKQRPKKGSLMHFSGHESYMDPTLYSLKTSDRKRSPLFIAEDPRGGRRSYSLVSSVLFLIAIQGYGELMNGIDRMHNPKKWEGDPIEIDKPSQEWLKRSFTVMENLEKKFWVAEPGFSVQSDLEESLKHGDDWTGIFAPAVSPVTGKPHAEPFANINLFPLWIGFTFPSGERSRHNLRNTLARLWHNADESGKRTSALVGTTARVGHFTGDVPGMLLTALIERNGKERYQAHRDILRIAAPAGEWGQFYNPDGRPIASDDPKWPNRLSPNECGINLDASMFALNGVRHVNVPFFDNQAVKVKLRMPEGARFLEMDNLKKDGRAFNVHVDEFRAPLSEEEKKQNDAQQDEKYKRDPKVDHRRFRFRMELLSENPTWQGRYQVDADVSGTMFVRYLFKGAKGGQRGIIEETEFWRRDAERFFLDDLAATEATTPELELTEGADLLVFTNRPQCAAIFGKKRVSYIDTGLPLTGRQLLRAIMKDGKPSHPKLFLDVGYDATDRRTFKRLLQDRRWKQALSRYEAAGGVIFRPGFITEFEVKSGRNWTTVAAPEGRLSLGSTSTGRTVRFTVTCEKARDDLVLRIGSGCGYKLRCNGEELAEELKPRLALRDQDALLVELQRGKNVFEVELSPNGTHVFFARITNSRGLPVDGVKH